MRNLGAIEKITLLRYEATLYFCNLLEVMKKTETIPNALVILLRLQKIGFFDVDCNLMQRAFSNKKKRKKEEFYLISERLCK